MAGSLWLSLDTAERSILRSAGEPAVSVAVTHANLPCLQASLKQLTNLKVQLGRKDSVVRLSLLPQMQPLHCTD